jgi:hypothetical protein
MSIATSNQRAELSGAAALPRIERFELIGDALTPTMRRKRRPVAEKYATAIDQLYA